MAQKVSITHTGQSSHSASAIVGLVSSGLTATGSTQADALALNDINEFTTVGSGTGALLPSGTTPGDEIFVYVATGQSTLTVYAPGTETINALTATTGFSVATNKSCSFRKVSNTRWVSNLTA